VTNWENVSLHFHDINLKTVEKHAPMHIYNCNKTKNRLHVGFVYNDAIKYQLMTLLYIHSCSHNDNLLYWTAHKMAQCGDYNMLLNHCWKTTLLSSQIQLVMHSVMSVCGSTALLMLQLLKDLT